MTASRPRKANTCNCGIDDRMMGTVSGIYTRTIKKVLEGGETAEIPDNEGQQREAYIMV